MHFISVLENIKIYIKIYIKIAPNVSVYDHHQGAYIWA